jgi:hypothetical protein
VVKLGLAERAERDVGGGGERGVQQDRFGSERSRARNGRDSEDLDGDERADRAEDPAAGGLAVGVGAVGPAREATGRDHGVAVAHLMMRARIAPSPARTRAAPDRGAVEVDALALAVEPRPVVLAPDGAQRDIALREWSGGCGAYARGAAGAVEVAAAADEPEERGAGRCDGERQRLREPCAVNDEERQLVHDVMVCERRRSRAVRSEQGWNISIVVERLPASRASFSGDCRQSLAIRT